MALGRDRRVQVGQRLLIIEPAAFRHEAFDELQHAVGAIDKSAQASRAHRHRRCGCCLRRASRSACAGLLGRRQIKQSQEVAELRSGRRPPRTAPCARHRPARTRRPGTCSADRLRRHGVGPRQTGPSRIQGGASALFRRAGDGDEFGRHRAVEIGPSELRRPLKRAILVEDDALVDKGGPRQKVREARVRTSDIRQDSSWESSHG